MDVAVHSGDGGPPSACEAFARTLSYNYNRRDTAINLVVLALCIAALGAATAAGSLTLGALFWLPLMLLIAALQCIVTLLADQQGFSLVWATLIGLMLYEELRWGVFSTAGLGSGICAICAASSAGLAVVHYAVEEMFIDEIPPVWEDASATASHRDSTRAISVWLHACMLFTWFRLGTTLLHALFIAIGALVGIAADLERDRGPAFWSVLGLGALASATLPCVLWHYHKIRNGCALGAVDPGGATLGTKRVMSDEELAIANLEAQLMRARDEISWLSCAATQRVDAPCDKAAVSSTKRAVCGASCPAGSTGGSSAGPELSGDAGEQVAAAERLDILRKREVQLVERIKARTGSLLA